MLNGEVKTYCFEVNFVYRNNVNILNLLTYIKKTKSQLHLIGLCFEE